MASVRAVSEGLDYEYSECALTVRVADVIEVQVDAQRAEVVAGQDKGEYMRRVGRRSKGEVELRDAGRSLIHSWQEIRSERTHAIVPSGSEDG